MAPTSAAPMVADISSAQQPSGSKSLGAALIKRTPPESPRRALGPAVALYLAALASKEEAAAVPLLLLLLDFFFVARQQPRDLAGRWRTHIVFIGLTVAGLIARRAATGTWLPAPSLAPSRYAATQLAVFPLYFLRALVPLDPALYRGVAPASWPPSPLIVLGWLGSRPAEGSYVAMAQVSTFYYFAFFLIIMPVLGLIETPRRLPNSITEAVLEKNRGGAPAQPATAAAAPQTKG